MNELIENKEITWIRYKEDMLNRFDIDVGGHIYSTFLSL